MPFEGNVYITVSNTSSQSVPLLEVGVCNPFVNPYSSVELSTPDGAITNVLKLPGLVVIALSTPAVDGVYTLSVGKGV